MAENKKKYVDLNALGYYDGLIKDYIGKADEVALKAAKDYADGLADNYESAGSVASAKTELQGKIDAVEAKADAAQSAADAAQGAADDLAAYVGEFTPAEGVATVVDYIDAKTAGIATDAALSELQGTVSGLQGEVAGIIADYLTSADKTELSNAIAGEKSRAEGVESGLASRIKAVEDDYLKGSDKTELQGNIDEVAGDVADIVADYLKGSDKTELEGKINAKADASALEAEVTAREEAVEDLQGQINLIMNNPDTKDVIDSIAEFTQYVADHGTVAEGMRTDINKNKEDLAAEVDRATKAESALSGRIDTLEAIDHEAYVGADATLKSEVMAEVNKKADATALEAAVEALEGVDAGIIERLESVEGQLTGGTGSVATQIATAKQEAIDAAVSAAATDATNKANAAESAAKTYADGLNTAMDTRVKVVEGKAHEHSNKTVLDGITAEKVTAWDGAVSKQHEHSNKSELDKIVDGDKAKWDAASAKAHTHENADVLNGITSEKVSAWDNAETKAKNYAKDYADGLNSTMDERVVALETKVGDGFVAITTTEIDALFA